jgi:hypothetical protein
MILLLTLALGIIAGLVVRAREHRRRAEGRLVRDYLEDHSFPGDTIADVLTEHGDVTITEVRRVAEAYRAGWRDAEESHRRKRTRSYYP